MARGDGIHRTSARNARMKDTDIDNAQAHNEREKSSYVNQDIVPERTQYNVHFKTPTAGYMEMFEQMRSDGVISTRGLKAEGIQVAKGFGRCKQADCKAQDRDRRFEAGDFRVQIRSQQAPYIGSGTQKRRASRESSTL